MLLLFDETGREENRHGAINVVRERSVSHAEPKINRRDAREAEKRRERQMGRNRIGQKRYERNSTALVGRFLLPGPRRVRYLAPSAVRSPPLKRSVEERDTSAIYCGNCVA